MTDEEGIYHRGICKCEPSITYIGYATYQQIMFMVITEKIDPHNLTIYCPLCDKIIEMKEVINYDRQD